MGQLEILDLHKMFEGKPLLNGVNFSVDAGETLCLLGSSGSGKSTILRIIAGIETPDSGKVLWQGTDISSVPVHKRGFGLMFQDYALFPHLSVSANVAFGLRMQGALRSDVDMAVKEALERVNMAGFGRRRVTDLSGGEQQRVALARALAPGPRLLMLDEPLAALDRRLRVELQEELRELLHQTGIPAIYVTHDQEEAVLLGDRLALLHNGRIVQDGAVEEVYRQPRNSWVANFLGMTNLLPGRVVSTAPLIIETACGEVFALPPAGAALPAPGQQVTLLVKPSALLLDDGRLSTHKIHGVVEEQRFLGEYYRARIRFCSGTSLEFLVAGSLQPGEQIDLNLNPTEVVLIPES